MSLHVKPSTTTDALAAAGSALLSDWAREAIAARGRAVIALAGGGTPRLLYPVWAARAGLDWTRVILAFGDERAVPPTHADSNYGMVQEALLAHLDAAPRVLRMAGEHPRLEQAAADYARDLRGVLDADGRLDAALLGLGADGHTASLFPGSAALDEAKRWCVAAPGPDGTSRRLTLTFPLLKRARHIAFLVAGADKAAVLRAVLHGPLDTRHLPAQTLLRDAALDVHLLLDAAAAAGLD